MENIWGWVGFHLLILVLLAIDLGVFRRSDEPFSTSKALGLSAFWIVLALVFNLGVYHWRGAEAGIAFFTGYVIEKSLSVDNLFVFLVIFSYFGIKSAHQQRILFWGVVGALVLRGAMIATGSWLVQEFHWMLNAFGAFLVVAGIRMMAPREENVDFEQNRLVKLIHRVVPVTPRLHDHRFFVRDLEHPSGRPRWVATPLLVVMIIVNVTDVIFALDSIPAVFAVTQDPFIVYTSNVFALLGLRALFFVLGEFMDRFRFLTVGLSLVLVFIGAKMLLSTWFHVSTGMSLGVISAILGAAVLFSITLPKATPLDQPTAETARSTLFKPRPDSPV